MINKQERKYQRCNRCIMDTTDPDIIFDENGICNHCTGAINRLSKMNFNNNQYQEKKLNELVAKIKTEGEKNNYDCIIGLSGGVDSSYLAYVVKNLGLRPLAVHVDNGWDSELAVKNIENIVKNLGIDLYTHVIDWEEFKDLQLSFLRASVVDLEMISDNAIVIAIYNLKKKFHIKYFIDGTNVSSESIMPTKWYYSPKFDSRNIKSIYKYYGNGKDLKTYPLLGFFGYIKYFYFKKGKSIDLLNYIDYDKEKAKEILKTKLGWRDYGGKHYESKITHFYQAFILPEKYNIDKRKAHIASLICSGQLSRLEALNELKRPIYDNVELEKDKEYFIKKLDLSEKTFQEIMEAPPRSHYEFPSYSQFFVNFHFFKKYLKWIKK